MNQFKEFREQCAKVCDDAVKDVFEFNDRAVIEAATNVCRNLSMRIRAMPLPEVVPDTEALRKENEQLREALIDLISIAKIHQDATKNRFAWAEIDCAEEALKGGAA